MKKISDVTVIVPAYNEANSIRETILSLKAQTAVPKEIIVVDDCSTDDTFQVAKRLQVTVIRPDVNTGSKAGAQNYALEGVNTKFVMAVDADTTLQKDAIEKLVPVFSNERVAAASGFVIPRFVKTMWERGRYVEYLLAFTFYKPIQDYFSKPLISSGCFSMYNTKILKSLGGWPTRTMAEDMDLTWTFYKENYQVRFVPDAVCYPIEPSNFHFMGKQLKRWSHGFIQNVVLHGKDVVKIPFLNTIIVIALWDGIIASAVYLFAIPLLSIFISPLFLLTYLIDAPVVLVPVLLKGLQRKEGRKVLLSFPSFFILRYVNSIYLIKALWDEVIARKPLLVYEKGH